MYQNKLDSSRKRAYAVATNFLQRIIRLVAVEKSEITNLLLRTCILEGGVIAVPMSIQGILEIM